jgi:ribosomal protein L37E
MKKCVVCGRETYHKIEDYTVCAACDVDGSFDSYKQSIAAQQKRAVDLRDSMPSQALPTPEVNPLAEVDQLPPANH